MSGAVIIGDRLVGRGNPCFVIAEAGVNHNGDMELAFKLVDAAVEAGADAVKFQSFVAEDLVTLDTPKAAYQQQTTGSTGAQFAMLKALELTAEEQARLKAHCDARGILYLCTPYERKSADMLDRLGVAAFKIASTDTTNVPLLAYISGLQRPMIVSTGMCGMGEVETAVNAVYGNGAGDRLILLHCTAEYPAPVVDLNLRAMNTLERAFRLPVGFSDHTPGVGASPWAVALGACVIEKHFTLDRSMKGPDHRASIEPTELRELVTTIRSVQQALGDGRKRVMPSEAGNKPVMQKSLVTQRNIAAGETIGADDLVCKRPATGLPPSMLDQVVGQKARIDIPANTILTATSIAWA